MFRIQSRTHFLLPILAAALTTGAAAQSSHPIDLGANYTYIRSNTGPDCGCFALNGGGALVQYGLSRHLAAVADLNVTHASNITTEGYTLTQTAYTFGARYTPVAPEYQIQPFGEFLVGAAHASGTLAPSSTGLGGSNTFALQTGGGVRVLLGNRLMVEPIRADYLMTKFANNTNDRQNDFRLSIGVLFRIKR
ncbi:outer membrane beta-barrel protein [Granulicella sibirica]|uniref:Outer membrane protein beta-barrel domain-containing protein n=1 Tax=Granulicella sibirica TaxID=2479048 RepID=A0A4Q0SWE2_9BACT|nr:outer membrane beta-barrel protein [Granulicella sibirica]RXH54742.1 hypothetical protein GRAN_3846 [Granulicella sibirica]